MWDFRNKVYAILEQEGNNKSILTRGHGNDSDEDASGTDNDALECAY